ncbi:MAG: zinc-finger domain-containing protein [Rhodospirillales bacterium]|nr:zinc-finger domain-containing protein [Rhodospirillales bacterium]
MTEMERIEVETDTAGCDGGGGPLGHPMVYLKIVPQTSAQAGIGEASVVCPYCSRQFVRKPGGDAYTDH